MRLIAILLALVILGFVIKNYLSSSASTSGVPLSSQQQAVQQAKDTVNQLNKELGEQDKRLKDSGK